jgi:hypothetical protein
VEEQWYIMRRDAVYCGSWPDFLKKYTDLPFRPEATIEEQEERLSQMDSSTRQHFLISNTEIIRFPKAEK